jgi:uncharacterized repeat protein (TIGR01451 family)
VIHLTVGESGGTCTVTNTPTNADLRIEKSDSKDPVKPGDELVYTITVHNDGPADAVSVKVTEDLPSMLTFVSTSGCAGDPNGVPTCSLGNIESGGSASYTVTVTVDSDATGTLVNAVEVTADTPDDNPGNNQDTETTEVEEPGCLDDTIYAVHDEGLRSSQIFTVTPTTIPEGCGPLRAGADIEGLESIGGRLYAVSSDTSSPWPLGGFYRVDDQCALTLIGVTGFDVEGLAVDGQGRMWGIAEDDGLILIDINTGHGTLRYRVSTKIEGISFGLDGVTLYGVGDNKLYVFDFMNGEWDVIATNLPGEAEGLETDLIGSRTAGHDILIVGIHGDPYLYFYDVPTKQLLSQLKIHTDPYDDIEGIVVCKDENDPPIEPSLVPSINVDKRVNGQDADSAPGPTLTVGAAVAFTYIVTNDGDVDLSGINVTDDMGVTVTCPGTSLAPGASMTCSGSSTVVAGQYRNVGEACGTAPDTTVVCDEDPAHYFGGSSCATNLVYAVDDQGTTGSQFFSVSLSVPASACGAALEHSDFEGLESLGAVLYAISAEGSGSFKAGGLYQLDGTCKPSLVGLTGIDDLEGLALERESGLFWAVAGNDSNLPEGSLVAIDPADGAKVVMQVLLASWNEREVEALVWSADGDTLLGGGDKNVYRFDFDAKRWVKIADGLPLAGDIEGLDIDLQASQQAGADVLVIGVHGSPTLYWYNLGTQKVIKTVNTGSFDDVEGIVVCR